jgi:Ca2+-binding EF-hand superfamily protein
MKEINYINFCHDVDKPEDMFPEYKAKKPVVEAAPREKGIGPASTFFNSSTKGINVLERRFGSQPVEISNDPSDVEDRIRATVVMKRVRIEEFFRDFDKLRKGKVTPNQFKGILSMLNFQLTEEEFQSLIAKYNTADNMFNHSDFCANINAAFTRKGIDKDPTYQVASQSSNDTFMARRKYLDISEDEHYAVDALIQEYKQAIKVKRLNLKPQFQGFDITKNGHVTKTQFVRVCSQLQCCASDQMMNCLLKRYMDKGNAEEVNYVDFCNDVDTPNEIFGVGRDYNHSTQYFPRNTPHIVGVDIVKDQPQDVDDILAKLRLKAKEQRIRFNEFMRDFDKLRSGFITEAQFRIGLNMGKVVLSSSEFGLLCENYKAAKEGKHVRWRDFCDDIEQVFTKKGLEKSVDIPLGDARTQTFYGKSGPSAHQKAQSQHMVEEFRDLLIKNRLDAKSFFQDWDRHKHFKISPKQFR